MVILYGLIAHFDTKGRDEGGGGGCIVKGMDQMRCCSNCPFRHERGGRW